jgi:hypothetical protein
LRGVVAVLLVLEALSSAIRMAGRLPVLVVYPWLTLAVMAIRMGVAVLQLTAGWMLLQDQRRGRALGFWSCLASAALFTFEIGLRFAPTNLFPTYRWPAVGLYWTYALAVAWYLRRDSASRSSALSLRE